MDLGESFFPAESEVSVSAAERALKLRPSPDTHFVLAKSLSWKAAVHTTEGEEKQASLLRAEKESKLAVSGAKQASADMYYTLGDILAMRASYAEADPALRRALDLNRANPNPNLQASIIRDLITVAVATKRPIDADKWFGALVESGAANEFDWRGQASRLDAAKRFSEAGASWQQAAKLSSWNWNWWCEAAGSFELAAGKEDLVLYNARKCISAGSGKSKSEAQLSGAHRSIAAVLNERGVFEEALSHAKELLSSCLRMQLPTISRRSPCLGFTEIKRRSTRPSRRYAFPTENSESCTSTWEVPTSKPRIGSSPGRATRKRQN